MAACAALSFLAGLYAQGPARQDPSTVVAIVDGKNVTLGEIQQILATAPPELSQQIRIDPQTGLLAWFSTLHLAKEGEQMKLDQKSPWKEEIEAMKAQYLRDARLNEEINGMRVTSDMVRKYYNDNQKNYQRARVRGVLIRYRPEVTAGDTSTEALQRAIQEQMGNTATRSEKEARDLAQSITNKLDAGEDMKDLVEKYSEDQVAKANGGDIGWVHPSSAHFAGFRNAVLILAKGQVSAPIPVPGGFYVVRIEDRGTIPLEDVTLEINQDIRNVHLNEFMNGIRNRFSPNIVNPDALAPYRLVPQK
jgi:parvulin-like peptidyl-prolyl isomerase